jgi:hypothetical protein
MGKKYYHCKVFKKSLKEVSLMTETEKDKIINRESLIDPKITMKDALVAAMVTANKSSSDKSLNIEDWECDLAPFIFKY